MILLPQLLHHDFLPLWSRVEGTLSVVYTRARLYPGRGCFSLHSRGTHTVVPASLRPVSLVFPKPLGPRDPFSLPVFTTPTFLLSFRCLSQGKEIRMLFLPSIPAHSYLSEDQPFPQQGPRPPLLPQGMVQRAAGSSADEPWGRDFGRATIRVSSFPPLPL